MSSRQGKFAGAGGRHMPRALVAERCCLRCLQLKINQQNPGDKAIVEIYNSSEMLNHDVKSLCLLYLEQVDRLITVVEQNHRNAMHVLNHVRHGVLQALEKE